MSSKLSLETEIAFFIDEYNAMFSHFKIENVQLNMIAKLECFFWAIVTLHLTSLA